MDKYNLKKIRNQLGLTQKDVADNNLSPNMLSTIETGKSSLTKQKALLLYKKYIEASFTKNISIDIDFDDLLSKNIEYQKYKMANDICSMLRDRVEHKDELSELQLEEYVKFALKTKIGLMRYFILIYSSQLLNEKNKTLKMQWCYKALDFLRWKDFSKISRLYKKALDIVKLLAFREHEYIKLIDYYEFYIQKMMENEEFVKSDIYFNLALFYLNIGDYYSAKTFFDNYKEIAKNVSIENKIEDLITEAVILFKTDEKKESIKLHKMGLKWIEEIGDKNLLYSKLIILSNLILYSIKYNYEVDKDDLMGYTTESYNILNKIFDSVSQKSRIMCSIALGFDYLGDIESSTILFKRAIRFSSTDSTKVERVYDFYNYSKNKVLNELIAETMLSIQFDKLSRKDKNMYMLLLLKMTHDTNLSEYKEELLKKIDNIEKEVR